MHCYEYLIEDIGVSPERMLFLDDRLDNIEGARASGLNAIQITNADQQLEALFGND